MKLTLQRLAEQINEAAPDYEVGGLQCLRAELHRKRARTQKLFSTATIFDHYAFPDGGRRELQYNIGFVSKLEDRPWRHGVAFSYERSQALPDPSILDPKVRRFNAWLRKNPGKLKGFKMSSWDVDSGWTGDKPLKEIPNEWMHDGNFIFIGKRWAESKFDIGDILKHFDSLYPTYRFVESGKE